MSKKKPTYKELESRLADAEQAIRKLHATQPGLASTAVLDQPDRSQRVKLTAALDSMLEGCQIIGFDWRYLYINEVGALHGHTSPDQLIGRSILEAYPGIDDSEPWPYMKRCMEQRVPHRMETPFVFPDGAKGWFELVIQPVDEGIFILSLDVTDRRMTHDALQTSEERFRSLVENVNAVVYTLTAEGRFDYISPTCRSILGYDPEEIKGKNFAELVHPDSLSACQQFLALVIDTGEPHGSIEYRVRHKSGHWKWQTTNGAAIRNDSGDAVAFLGVTHDITDQKHAEQVLRESEKRLELALDGAELGLWDWDIPSGEITLNARWVEMLGYTLDEFMPHVSQWQDLLHPEDAPGVLKVLDEHLQGETDRYETEYRLRHKSGHWVWILDKGRITERSRDGKPLRACGTHLDITARKTAEGELRDRTTELEQIFAAVPNALVYTDANRRISHVNPAFVRIFGYSPEEVIGRTTEFLYADKGNYVVQGRLRYNQEAPVSHAPFELELVRKNGDQFPAETVGTSLKDAEGRTIGFVALVSDITDRKFAQHRIWESETILKAAMDNAQVGIVIADAHDGQIRYMNEAASPLGGTHCNRSEHGISLQEYSQSWPIRHADGTPYEPDETPLSRAIHDGETCDEEYCLTAADGKDRIIWARAAPIRNERGEVIRGIVVTTDVTEQRSIESALRRSEERLNDAQRIAGLGDFTWDTETDQISWSDALFELLLYDKNEHIDYRKVNSRIHHPDDAEYVTRWLRGAIESGEDRLPPNEYRLIRKDGSTINVRTVGVIHHRENRAPIVFGTVYDITESTLAGNALRESQRQLTTLMSNLPGMAYRCRNDEQWTMEFVSDGCRNLCGYAAEELMNNRRISYEDIILPEDRQIVRDTVNKGLQSMQAFEMTYRITTAEGAIKWVWEQGRGVFNEQDILVAIEGFIADINERKRAELERETIAEASRILLAADSMEEVYSVLPGTLARQLDYPIAAIELHDPVNKQMIYVGSYGLPEPTNRPACIALNSAATGLVATTGQAVVDVNVQERPEPRFESLRSLGAQTFVCVPASVGGRIVGTVAVADTKKHDDALADVHPLQVIANHLAEQIERRNAAKELARHRDRLEELVKIRTAELEHAHRKMVQQERLATLGQLTATVSHELRNPLGTIRSSVFSIRASLNEPNDALTNILDRAERNIIRCDMIIEELLDYTRTRHISTSVTPIDSWVEEVVGEYVVPQEISLVLRCDAKIVLSIDREKLRRCLINLLANACQAMEENDDRDRTLTVETEMVNSRFEIRVIDSGSGIPAEHLKKVFEPLYSTKGFGVGLGLAIVQQIAQAHGGGIDIKSELGHGTCATLWLPVSRD